MREPSKKQDSVSNARRRAKRGQESFDDQKRDPSKSATKGLEITAHELVGTFMSARIDFTGGCVDQCAIDVKGPQGTILIEGHTGLNSFQRMFGHEERSFHRAIISPEPYSSPRVVVTATITWKTQGHALTFSISKLPCCSHLA